jgi:hypothetical protein
MPKRVPRRLAGAQAAYYVATGLWPLVSARSFQAVTGPKQDFWLVQTVGALIGVSGATLAIATQDRDSLESPALRVLAVGTALSLTAVDLVFVLRRRISPIYLADAAVELVIVTGWLRPATSRA